MRNIKYLIIGSILFLSGCGGIEPINEPPKIVIPDPIVVTPIEVDFPLITTWAFGEDDEDGVIPCAFDFTDVYFNVPGTYTAECTVTDADGDTATSSFSIVVEDQTPPKIQKMSSHQSVFKVDTTIDFDSNILIIDNYDEDLDIVIDDSAVVYNTPGTYDVEYTATDDAGNETVLVVEYTLTRTTIPTFTETISSDQSHLLINYGVTDPDGTFLRLDVKVEKEGEEFMVDSFFDVTFEIEIPVPSDTQFKITLTYLYDLGGDQGIIERKRAEEIMSDSWEIPELEIEATYASEAEFDLDVFYIDPDTRVLDATLSISDESGELYNYDIQFPESILVAIPYTGHNYTLLLTYTYDMGDETGIHEVVIEEMYINPQIPVPSINILYNPVVLERVILDFHVEGFEYITSPQIEVSIQNEEGTAPLETISFAPIDMQYIEFAGLNNGAVYIVKFSYEYDLRDGMGIQQTEYEYYVYTHILEIASITLAYDVIVGDDAFFSVEIINPENLDILGVEINGTTLYGILDAGFGFYELVIPHTELTQGVNHFTITGIGVWNGSTDVLNAINYNNTFSVTVIGNPI